MSTTPKASAGGGFAILIGVVAALFWLWSIAALSSLAGSDAAGNAMSQGFAALEVIVLWAITGVLVLIAAVKGALPVWAKLVALILVPVSCLATFAALDLLSHPYDAPFLWPLVIPALLPPLVIALSWWALLPSLQRLVASRAVAPALCGAIVIVCASIIPFQHMRGVTSQREADTRAAYDAALAAVPQDARLWELTPFLGKYLDDPVLERIRKLDKRQSEAETMLERGDFPLQYLGAIDLMPTPPICEKARALLRRQVAPLVAHAPNVRPYSEVARPVMGALAAMKWLVGYDCSCDAESLAWENMANAYRDPSYDVFELKNLRDPQALGKILREYPAHFSMLTPKAHLKAWLRYADNDKSVRAQALEGARKLDHRAADAIEMLNDKNDIGAPWMALKYMPVLDLEPTPALCVGALKQIRGDLDKVLRPRVDDPRSYDELLSRLGAYEPLTALVWAAGHGCDADAELAEADAVIRTYKPSPDSAAMLASIAKLRRKP